MSWKGYGGIHKSDTNNNITAYSIVADIFTLRQSSYGAFDICGEAHVSGNLNIDSTIYGNSIIVDNDLSTNRLFVVANTELHDVDIYGNLRHHTGNVFIDNNLDISGNIRVLQKQLYMGNSQQGFFYGDVSGNIGVNLDHPISSFDISSQYPFAFNVGSKSIPEIYSVPLQNNSNKGFVLKANATTSQLGFYNETKVLPVTNTPDSYIRYASGGFLTIDTSQNINLYSNVSFSNRNPSTNAHVMGEPVVIYDTSAGPYLYSIYANASETTGNALSLIANDASSVTFMNMITPNRQGISIGGGQYPNDPTKSYGSIGWRDGNSNYTPSINIVSGKSKIKQKTTVGINTHAPTVENYAFEVNGPVHLKNGELTITQQAGFEIKAMASFKQNAIAVGSYYKTDRFSPTQLIYRSQILYTTDGGETWNSNYDIYGSTFENPVALSINSWNCAYAYDSSLSIIAGDGGYMYYTYNWFTGLSNRNALQNITTNLSQSYTIKTIYITSSKRVFYGVNNTSTNTPIGVYWFDLPTNVYSSNYGLDINNFSRGNITFSTYANPITSIDGSGSKLWITCGASIFTINDTTTPSSSLTRTSPNNTIYNSISAFNSNNVAAGGQNIISWSNNGGTSWTDYPLSNITVNKIYLFDASNAIAICNNGIILASTDGYQTWPVVSNDALNVSGNASRLIDPNYNLNCLAMATSKNLFITKTITTSSVVTNDPNPRFGNTILFNAYLPNVFNNVTNYVFDVSGSCNFSGDLNINDGGKIASNNRIFNLLTNGVNRINFGGDASNVIIASPLNSTVVANYNLNVNNILTVYGNAIISGGNNMTVSTTNTIYYNNVSIGRTQPAVDGYIFDVYGNVNISNGNLSVRSANTIYYNNVSVGKGQNAAGGYILDVCGNVNINTNYGGNLSVRSTNTIYYNNVSIGTQQPALDTYILDVSGNVTINNGKVVVRSSNSIYYNNVSIGTTQNASGGYILDVYGNVNISNGNLSVRSANTIYYNNVSIGTQQPASTNFILDIRGNAQIDGILNVLNTVIFMKDLSVSGNTNMYKNLTIYGGPLGDGNLNVTGTANISQNLNVTRTANISQNLKVTGTADISSNLNVTGTANIGGNLNVTGTANISQNLKVTGTADISSNLNIAGNANIGGNLNVTGTGTFGYLTIDNLNVNQNIIVTGYVKADYFNATSDRRLKTNISPLVSQWNSLKQIHPVTFDWIATGHPDIGFIAQNIYNTYPQIRPANPNADPKSGVDEPLDLSGNPIYYAIDYGRMTPFLWQGMREIMQRVESLEQENAELKTRVTLLESK